LRITAQNPGGRRLLKILYTNPCLQDNQGLLIERIQPVLKELCKSAVIHAKISDKHDVFLYLITVFPFQAHGKVVSQCRHMLPSFYS